MVIEAAVQCLKWPLVAVHMSAMNNIVEISLMMQRRQWMEFDFYGRMPDGRGQPLTLSFVRLLVWRASVASVQHQHLPSRDFIGHWTLNMPSAPQRSSRLLSFLPVIHSFSSHEQRPSRHIAALVVQLRFCFYLRSYALAINDGYRLSLLLF